MSKLNVDQKTIKDLFQDKKADFLIPDYQRPYAWGETECQTLWDDIFSFAIPDEGRVEFDSNSEYFLGPIVTFRNTNFKMEVIDGQQRLTTLMLLLRAFYTKFGHMQDKASVATKQNIEKCIWKTDEFGEPDMATLKIDSEVATDKVHIAGKQLIHWRTIYRMEYFFSKFLKFLPSLNKGIFFPLAGIEFIKLRLKNVGIRKWHTAII